MTYPDTRQDAIVEDHFGVTVPDPFRWLENDPRQDTEVATWIEAQNAASAPYLAALDGRDVFRDRLTAHFNHETALPPAKRNGKYFFIRNSGMDDQPRLILRDGVDGPDRVLIDPNTWSADGTTALAEWAPSSDGGHVAYAVQVGGTDWRTIRVMDTATSTILDDEIEWARFTNIAWAADGAGFYYSRFPEPAADAGFDAPIDGHAIYFHRLGTPQAEDRLIHAPTPGLPLLHTVDVTSDGRYIIIYTSALTGGAQVTVIDTNDADLSPVTLVESYDDSWVLLGNIGPHMIWATQKDAPRGKVVTINLDAAAPQFTDLIAEKPDAVLREGSAIVAGDRIVLSYMVDAQSRVERYTLDGTFEGLVDLPGPGTTGAFQGQPGDDEAFFAFTSYDAPLTIHRLEVGANRSSVWAAPNVDIDLDRIIVEPHIYTSKDGARVPLFVMRRKDVTGPAPTMLYAYGGFAISIVPHYSPAAIAWVEQGGVYAVANIRGGGEYGSAWHHGGRRADKQNSFDDFIAAGEYLKASGITSADGLAIHGESNGGLLVGAVVNQRPDLFAAALPGVGVLDMLRFERFTSGSMWVQEFGDPKVEADFQTLHAYSPLHTIRDGASYPAILATTADTDNRVVPSHSFKYVAALQSADLGPHPHLLRVETRAGHGAGKPMRMVVDEFADRWAFAARWTGLKVSMPD
ncbi:S9 family peptidase [Fertoebacter nigrum]|uniref:prolyl oligopeptidase n=1 Tax=Fertoeibacter niger TaxID=2656921 RepID=A0A8X8H2G7_9RHOB|nr:prolyl oligopeptidase family serine peptidase [Fertoeibacter niger]NUB44987.1 S9 family peptidase [Fertoeibacter niger]